MNESPAMFKESEPGCAHWPPAWVQLGTEVAPGQFRASLPPILPLLPLLLRPGPHLGL